MRTCLFISIFCFVTRKSLIEGHLQEVKNTVDSGINQLINQSFRDFLLATYNAQVNLLNQ